MNVKLGIDFGTTHTVVTRVDRGNYPIVSFEDAGSAALEWYPTIAAVRQGEWRFGLDAQAVADSDDWYVLRSFKRLLAECSPQYRVQTKEGDISIIDLLSRFLSALKQDLIRRSNLEITAETTLEAMISVPANANNNQRFLTAEAFRLAGFEVLGMLNEPTAAGMEYAHRFGVAGVRGRKHYLLVFDLGGGTFDVSLIGVGPHQYETLATDSITRLGGDDFDEVLFDLVVNKLSLEEPLTHAQKTRLLEECRRKKESLHPNSRRLFIDLDPIIPGESSIEILVENYYAACTPLVQQALVVVGRVLDGAKALNGIEEADIASLYIVGGGSHLPLVGKMLRESYQRLVRRSAYPHGAVAVGLAVAADSAGTLELREQFARDFGVWREADSGDEIIMDCLFPKGTQLPAPGEPPLTVRRSYRPRHNIGCFRYLECGRVSAQGAPSDDMTLLKEVRFPFDATLRDQDNVEDFEIVPLTDQMSAAVEEIYACSADGVIRLTIRDTSTGFEKDYFLISD